MVCFRANLQVFHHRIARRLHEEEGLGNKMEVETVQRKLCFSSVITVQDYVLPHILCDSEYNLRGTLVSPAWTLTCPSEAGSDLSRAFYHSSHDIGCTCLSYKVALSLSVWLSACRGGIVVAL